MTSCGLLLWPAGRVRDGPIDLAASGDVSSPGRRGWREGIVENLLLDGTAGWPAGWTLRQVAADTDSSRGAMAGLRSSVPFQ